jgi:hypothetical protein
VTPAANKENMEAEIATPWETPKPTIQPITNAEKHQVFVGHVKALVLGSDRNRQSLGRTAADSWFAFVSALKYQWIFND